MKGAVRTLARLHRLERVRFIAKQTAASEAARAESTLAQLQALATRSGHLASEYNGRTDAGHGADLHRLALFACGLQGVCRNTRVDAARAQSLADLRQGELALAERRRAAVEERAAAAGRDIASRAQAPILSGRQKWSKE